jgi:hypothetical protein
MTTEETVAPEAPETESAESEVSAPSTPRVGLHSMLTRDSDMASRPGFRSPSNKRSKAQSGGGKSRSKPVVKRKKGKKKR